MEVKRSLVKKIQWNVLIGLIFFVIFVGVSFYVVTKWVYKKERENLERSVSTAISSSIHLQGDSNFKEALLFAENGKVKEIYLSLKKEVGDLSKLTEENKKTFEKYGRMLREEVSDPLLKAIERETGKKPHIHFHLPGPRSFLRATKKVGEDIKLDDLSGFRFSIIEAQKTKKKVIGLEAGRDGVIYRNVVPIVVNGEVLGSVESGDSLDAYLEKFLKENSDIKTYAIFLKKDLEKIMDFYLQSGKAKSLDKAILYAKSQNFEERYLKEVLEHLGKGGFAEHTEALEVGSILLIHTPLKSFKGEVIGYAVLGYDLSGVVNTFRMSGILIMGLIVLFGLIYLITLTRSLRSCAGNLIATARAMEELGSGRGDLTFRLQAGSQDEIGLIAKNFNAFMETLSGIIKTLIEKVRALFTESESLEREVKVLEEASLDFKEKADFIALSSAEILSSMEEVSNSLQELSKAISEISQRAIDTSSVVKETVSTVDATKEKVELLVKASSEIDEVVNLINSIAEQTNLLALNASIEAARAGEAGKGFAVVANEVKELARQTQEATKVIAEKIKLLQESSSEVSGSVGGIVELIKRVEEASTAIAGAVEEQTIVVNTVSEHILGVKDKVMINEEQANAIKNSVETLVTLAERLKKVSLEVKGIANEIKEITSQFKV